jgi:hypothetical protein
MIGLSWQRIWPYEKDNLLSVIPNKFPTIDVQKRNSYLEGYKCLGNC